MLETSYISGSGLCKSDIVDERNLLGVPDMKGSKLIERGLVESGFPPAIIMVPLRLVLPVRGVYRSLVCVTVVFITISM